MAQMRDSVREALAMVHGRTRRDLDSDRKLNLALVRLMEILSEAASRVPTAERARPAGLPWQQVVGMRNRLIHAYEEIDFDILWQIVTRDLPPLPESLDVILGRKDSP